MPPSSIRDAAILDPRCHVLGHVLAATIRIQGDATEFDPIGDGNREGIRMEKLNYEYKIVKEQNALSFVESVNMLGKDGWRIINYTSATPMQALLERSVEAAKAAESERQQAESEHQQADELSLPSSTTA
jgi:hypothetical protein